MLGDPIPTYMTIVVQTLTEVDLLLKNYIYDGYSALSSYLKPVLGSLTVLYIIILGYGVLTGTVKMQMGTFMRSILKIAFIYVAVTEWSWVSENFVGLVNAIISGAGDALISASPVHIPGVDGIDGAMQETLIQFTKIGSLLFNTGGWTNLGGWMDGFIVWAFGYIIVGIGLFEIILAKVMLAILFVFTPLIVLFCYFKPLQPTFDRWLGAIVGYALLQLFVTSGMALALSLAYWWSALHIGESALQIGNYGTLPLIVIGIVCLGIIFKAADLAQNLGGVVSSSSGSAMVGGIVGGAVGSSLSAASSGAGGVKSIRKKMKERAEERARSAMRDVSSSIRSGD